MNQMFYMMFNLWKVIALPSNFANLLESAAAELGIRAQRIFNNSGAEICNISLIR